MDDKHKPGQRDHSRNRPAAPVVWGKGRHRISKKDIDPDALKIGYRLNKLGFIAYLTGAAVQNLHQGIPPKDFDIVTDARPGQIKKRFANTYLIGKRFRLAHVHFQNGKIIEVATFRRTQDAATEENRDKSAHWKDTYGTPRQDAFRRDISINALYYDMATEAVIDYVGGLKDLDQKSIRVIGDPAERYAEDPVRILRVIRHSARLGFEIEGATERAIVSRRQLLSDCPGARLFEELKKDLSLKTRPVLESLGKYGLLTTYLGQAGQAYESDSALFSRLASLLDVVEEARSAGASFSSLEIFALVHWPWVESRFSGTEGDLFKVLDDLFKAHPSAVSLPKKFLADALQILVLIRLLNQSLRTGRWRYSWKRRSQYAPAARLSFLIEKKRLPGDGETFDGLHRRVFRSRRKRRRPRRKDNIRNDRDKTNPSAPSDHRPLT